MKGGEHMRDRHERENPEVVRDIDLLGAEAISALRKFLAQGEVTSADVARAKVAATAFSGWTRHKATESARDSNTLALIRELAADKEQFREFVRLSLPNAPVLKALPKGK